jgi:Holliday junction resolvasome RuvABC endonuclease subunit
VTTRYFAGIDPGLTGAIAVIRCVEGAQRPTLDAAWSIPVFYKATGKPGVDRRRYDLAAVLRMMQSLTVYEPVMVCIEDVAGRGNQKGGSQLSYGVGMLHMAAEAAGLPVHLAASSTWKAVLRCPASKPRAVRLAYSMVEGAEGKFTGPRGGMLDGLAEAALLACYAFQKFGRK